MELKDLIFLKVSQPLLIYFKNNYFKIVSFIAKKL